MFADKNEKREYSIQEYDPKWVEKFETIKSALKKVFGNKALRIEHIGSTSIPGMKAKPLIDVLVVVQDIHHLEIEREAMITSGYQWAKDYIAPGTYIFYQTGLGNSKIENIHVTQPDSYKVKQFLAKRDYFRAFPQKAKEYSDLKEMLNKQFPGDYVAYREGKKPFLEGIEEEAYQWYDAQEQ